MDKAQSNLDFRLMSLMFKARDMVAPRKPILEEVGIQPGFRVLDYGCGPGSYITPLVRLVGDSGRVYALDINPLAVTTVQRMASKGQLTNVETILSGCKTDLPDRSVDVVILYDTLHGLEEPGAVLAELHRVLKSAGILSVHVHHLSDEELARRVTRGGLFRLSRKGRRTTTFSKAGGTA